MNKTKHEVQCCIDWDKIESGAVLTKFVAIDKGEGGDFTVELHGFFDTTGKVYITDRKITGADLLSKKYKI